MGSVVQPHGGLPPMWLGDFETAVFAGSKSPSPLATPSASHLLRSASPILPEVVQHWHGNQSPT